MDTQMHKTREAWAKHLSAYHRGEVDKHPWGLSGARWIIEPYADNISNDPLEWGAQAGMFGITPPWNLHYACYTVTRSEG